MGCPYYGCPLFKFERRNFMLKKTITYRDYNGVERKEDFYFNLTQAELTEMQMSVNGGLTEMINKLVSTQDAPAIIKVFKNLILKSYGEKSLDGKKFVKSEEISTAFLQTEAYSNLFMELATDADKAAEFFNGIIPTNANNDATGNKNIKNVAVN
jgi:hypothetical protein